MTYERYKLVLKKIIDTMDEVKKEVHMDTFIRITKQYGFHMAITEREIRDVLHLTPFDVIIKDKPISFNFKKA